MTLDNVLFAHEIALKNGGGVHGTKDESLILSAIGRPYHEYAGHVLYPSVIDKAGCLLHALLNNHGFNDASKRTAWMVCNSFLFVEDHALVLPEEYPWYDKLAEMVEEGWSVEQVINWVEGFCKSYPSSEALEANIETFYG
ncbi:Fic family protein [Litoreibacter sp.]|nr:Fic family protein [Litoreibacter sp.]